MGLKSNKKMNKKGEEEMLKSDQNGIEIKRGSSRHIFAVSTLKSDQNGIEIQAPPTTHWCACGLKSDQNGIEIHLPQHRGRDPRIVKIRPKWDWNISDSGASTIEYSG